MDSKITVKELNQNFICAICNGYLIRPVAITECLHYFCRSCIVKYLETAAEYKCPNCATLIHETNPWDMLREDKKLEFLVYKLVPNLAQNERNRRKLFYSRRGMLDPDACDADSNLNLCNQVSKKEKVEEENKTSEKQNVKMLDDSQIGLFLDFVEPDSNLRGFVNFKFCQLEKPYIRTSSHITIGHLKKYLKKKLLSGDFDYDILCNGELMGRHHTLEFIYLTRWRYKEGILELGYRPKIEKAIS